ncbi:MAG: type IV pilus secretin PilQ [Desulfoplanes sp.]|nr:type IV pilus secretin PilQ [Desulfoplanes sp.]
MITFGSNPHFLGVYLFLGMLLVGLGGCAVSKGHQTETVTAAAVASPKTADAPRKEVPDSLSAVWVQDGKTFVAIPLARDTEVTPFLDANILTLSFAPDTVPLTTPLESAGVLRESVPDLDATSGKMIRLQMVLNSPVQFLLTRTSPESLRIILIPKAAQKLPAKQNNRSDDIAGVDFSRNKMGNLFVSMKVGEGVGFEPRDEQPGRMSFLLKHAHVPARFAKLYRLDKFSTSMDSLLLRDVPGGCLMTFLSSERIPVQIDRRAGQLVLQFMTREIDRTLRVPAEQTIDPLAGENKKFRKTSDKADADLLEMNTLFPGMKKSYAGQKISIDLQDADVELALRLISKVSGQNLIIDKEVSGTISLLLQNIPWDQALEVVLQQEHLGMVIQGTIMRISTAKKLEAESDQRRRAREAALQARESLTSLEPLQTKYLQINYSTAAEIEPKIREFLSPRGKISQDARTNMLIIRDAGSQLEKIEGVVAKLDRPERQVLIEARIVYATDSFQRSLGISWSGDYSHREIEDTTSKYPRSFNVEGLSLPADVGGIDAGAQIAKIAGLDLFSLDAQLRLGELKNIAKTISSPRVVTLNNNRAEIKQGTKVASQAESESGGTTTEYTDAILSLSVQPQITPDNKLILDLDISDDAPDSGDISTRSTKTKMIVSDNETIVIGGVQNSTESNMEDRVPGLASIPGLGWLFKNQSTTNDKEELLIFIRPKILD